jgi:hypothetical protein
MCAIIVILCYKPEWPPFRRLSLSIYHPFSFLLLIILIIHLHLQDAGLRERERVRESRKDEIMMTKDDTEKMSPKITVVFLHTEIESNSSLSSSSFIIPHHHPLFSFFLSLSSQHPEDEDG